jgi:hypothetical protein
MSAAMSLIHRPGLRHPRRPNPPAGGAVSTGGCWGQWLGGAWPSS